MRLNAVGKERGDVWGITCLIAGVSDMRLERFLLHIFGAM